MKHKKFEIQLQNELYKHVKTLFGYEKMNETYEWL